MRSLPRLTGDALLGLFAVAVFVGAGVVVKQANPPLPTTASSASSTEAAVVQSTPPTPTTTPAAAAPSSTAVPRRLLLIGPDLAKLGPAVADASGDTVEARAAFSSVQGQEPDQVVLQIVAGSRTSVRTADAITAVRSRWPGMVIAVVGPFSSGDRKSAAAVKAAAASAKATFLDPVLLHWRSVDTKATLTKADLAVVAGKLAAAL